MTKDNKMLVFSNNTILDEGILHSIFIIKEAGVGVAMGNAGEDMKQVADFITTHVDEDGVKNALIKYGVIAEN